MKLRMELDLKMEQASEIYKGEDVKIKAIGDDQVLIEADCSYDRAIELMTLTECSGNRSIELRR